VALLAAALLLAACARDGGPQWLPAAAWWGEDAARGVGRDPDELRRDDAGTRTVRLAAWAEGDRIRNERLLPEPLRSRAARWPAVRAGLAGGGLVSGPDGLIAVAATGAARTALRPLAEAENRDRLRGDAIMAALMDLDDRERRRWEARLREARAGLDAVRAGSQPAP
jgi:hypothetical protein